MILKVIAFIIVGMVLASVFFPDMDVFGKSGKGFDKVVEWAGKLWAIVVFVVLGIFVLPAMFIMAKWYSVWETWIKEMGDIKDSWIRIILLIPLSVLIGYAIIVMQLLHKPFEDKVSTWFGKKPF